MKNYGTMPFLYLSQFTLKKKQFISTINSKIVHKVEYSENDLLELEVSISGVFSMGKEPNYNNEDNFKIIKYQFPTLLMPYLRSTVTSFFANAGFGTFIFPLINIVELAKKTILEDKVQVIE